MNSQNRHTNLSTSISISWRSTNSDSGRGAYPTTLWTKRRNSFSLPLYSQSILLRWRAGQACAAAGEIQSWSTWSICALSVVALPSSGRLRLSVREEMRGYGTAAAVLPRTRGLGSRWSLARGTPGPSGQVVGRQCFKGRITMQFSSLNLFVLTEFHEKYPKYFTQKCFI